jgi:threonylcarbamoyladenosine tRNA methylthiotransferase MtaB
VESFCVENFGCRATQADGAALARQFRERGLEQVARPREAQVVVVNTCTVTQAADQEARSTIRRIHRENPHCRIVVTGCYAQRAPEELAALPGVALVVGHSHQHQLVDIAISRLLAEKGVKPPEWGESRARKASDFVPLARLTPGSCEGMASADRPTTSQAGTIFVSDIFAHTQLLAAPVFDMAQGRTRPILKVQDGCNNRCSFCVIPHVRGSSRSLPLGRILDEVNQLISAGYREVVLSGINLGRWGRDLGRFQPGARRGEAPGGIPPISEASGSSLPQTTREPSPSLADLVASILAQTSLEKLRISSVEPMDWSEELIELVAKSPRIAKHAHVPLQSGSDRILRRMHRKYRPWHYRQKIRALRQAMPAAAIGADVMVGFPGESDWDFLETQRMVEELPFTYLHVFPYSPRPGTEAAAMEDQVSPEVAADRSRILRQLGAEKKLGFMRSFVGRSLEAITLHSRATPVARESHGTRGTPEPIFTEALTDNYLKLRLRGRHEPNLWFEAEIEDLEDGKLIGVARDRL